MTSIDPKMICSGVTCVFRDWDFLVVFLVGVTIPATVVFGLSFLVRRELKLLDRILISILISFLVWTVFFVYLELKTPPPLRIMF